eukprot:scaffold8454_cov115-Amphora_coffeaeformis.AAC.2
MILKVVSIGAMAFMGAHNNDAGMKDTMKTLLESLVHSNNNGNQKEAAKTGTKKRDKPAGTIITTGGLDGSDDDSIDNYLETVKRQRKED